jgi:hypothetical protein
MKYRFLTVLFLISFMPSIVGSEQPIVVPEQKKYDQLNKPVEIFVHFNSDARDLYYVGEKRMEYLKQKPAANSPCFINCEYRSEDLRTNLDDMLDSIIQSSNMNTEDDYKQYRLLSNSTRLQKITENFKTLHPQNIIPLRYFLTDTEQFKNKGDILFKFTEKIEKDEIFFEVKLGEDLSNIDAQKIITQFCNSNAQHITSDRDELQKNAIIDYVQGYRYNSGSFKHGALSYKVELDSKKLQEKADASRKKNEEEKKQKEQQAQEKAVLYSKIKKTLFGGSIAAIIAYLLYQKFYNTAELI